MADDAGPPPDMQDEPGSEEPRPPIETVQVEVSEERAASQGPSRRAQLELKPTHKLGKELVQWFLIGIAVVGAAILAWAFFSYPDFADVRDLESLSSSDATENPAETLATLRAEWLDSVIRLSQTFVFGSLLPVVTTIIGYIFGRQDD